MLSSSKARNPLDLNDPLPELAQIANDEGLWYHVDAAYGGFFQLTKRGRERLTGIEHADSVVLDPQKGLFVPFGTGCLLVRSEEVLRDSHSGGDAPYLHNIHELGGDDVHLPDFADLSPELTRPNRGLRLWLPLQLHGVAAFRGALDHKLDLAQQVYDTLIEMPQLRVLDEPDLSVIAFHCCSAMRRSIRSNRVSPIMSLIFWSVSSCPWILESVKR